ncbi:MAG: TetR/AcrR family transcriptional regulator [Arachnia sp.]
MRLRTPADERILLAARDLFGRQGIRTTTVRQIAEAAEVSPGLVIHHFGSKDGLRDACDEQLMVQLAQATDSLGDDKDAFHPMAKLALLESSLSYLNASLLAGGPGADQLFDGLCDLTEVMFAAMPDQVRPSSDPRALVATVVAQSCGIGLLGDRIAHRLGGQSLTDPDVYSRSTASALEAYTEGLLVDRQWLDSMRQTAASALIADSDPPGDEAPTQ